MSQCFSHQIFSKSAVNIKLALATYATESSLSRVKGVKTIAFAKIGNFENIQKGKLQILVPVLDKFSTSVVEW